jgi:hypothetical protein
LEAGAVGRHRPSSKITPIRQREAREQECAMYEIIKAISEMGPPFNMIVFVMLFACGASVCKVVAKQVREYGCHRQDTDFKRELVERGLHADEIERIINASSPDKDA